MRARSYYFWLLLLVVAVLISASMIAMWGAWQDRNGKLARLSVTAENLSSLLDSEVHETEARLIGLSSSPLVLHDNIPAFHEQMVRLIKPNGSHVVISDKTRQLANSLRPYGEDLPLLSEYTPQPDFFNTLETKGVYVSSKIYGRVLDRAYVTVSVKIPDNEGHLKYILTSAIDDASLLAIMQSSERLPAEIRLQLIDFMGQDLVDWHDGNETIPSVDLPSLSELSEDSYSKGDSGFFRADNEPRTITAYHRSALTGWTVGVTQTRSMIDQPVTQAINLLTLFALGLTSLILVSSYWFRTKIQRPFNTMKTQLDDTRSEVTSLMSGLATARSEEQERIAQELHDTTAQRLVAAKLYLENLSGYASDNKQAQKLREVQILITQSLNELRTLAFLLHIPRPEIPFHVSLGNLVEGFSSRAGLACETKISSRIDDLDQLQQGSLYRITQEALANIHRHASARKITVVADCLKGECALTVEDDGRGGISYPSKGAQRGLGITGIQKTISALGGSLTIVPCHPGTRLIARFPVTKPDPDAQMPRAPTDPL